MSGLQKWSPERISCTLFRAVVLIEPSEKSANKAKCNRIGKTQASKVISSEDSQKGKPEDAFLHVSASVCAEVNTVAGVHRGTNNDDTTQDRSQTQKDCCGNFHGIPPL
jgi:hypothetical protein